MALKIEWTERAFLHLEEIFINREDKKDSRSYSVKLYSLIQSCLELLSKYPESGRCTDNKKLNKKIVKDFYLYYSYDETTLTVIGLINMQRDPDYLLQFENN